LAMHMPESISRQSSASSRQSESLEQLKKLRLELLSDRQQQQGPLPGIMQEMFLDSPVHQKQQQQQPQQPQQPTKPQPRTPRAPHAQLAHRQHDTFVPAQTPYYTAEFLKSPMSTCMSAEMLNQVDDIVISDSKNDQETKDHPIQHRQPSWMTYNTKGSKVSSSGNSKTASLSSSHKMRVVTGARKQQEEIPPPSSTQTPVFDIQRVLERQLQAKLPGSRPPGALESGQSFDDHSYIISSGTKSLDSRSKTSSQERRRLNDMVSVVPCDSYQAMLPSQVGGPSGSFQQIHHLQNDPRPNYKFGTSKRAVKLKRLPPEQRCDTVKIDGGLSIVDPNNLKPAMQEILQKKKEEHRGPVQQRGKIVEAKDLFESPKQRTSKTKLIGAKLKGMFQDTFKDTTMSLQRMSPRRQRRPSSPSPNSRFPARPLTPAELKEKEQEERQWVRQTIQQENYKITKVLAPDANVLGSDNKQTSPPPMPMPPPTLTPSSKKIISAHAQKGYNKISKLLGSDKKQWASSAKHSPLQENLKINKVLRPDDKQGSSLSARLSGPGDHVKPLGKNSSADVMSASETSGDNTKSGKNMEIVIAAEGSDPMYKIPFRRKQQQQKKEPPSSLGLAEAIARRQKQKALLSKLGKKHSSVASDPEQSTSSIVSSPVGSFFLDNSPSLDTLNTHKVNEVLGLYAQNTETNRLLMDDEDEEDDASKVVVSEKESVRKKTEALRDAKIALLFSLKNKIVSEIKKQKLQEQEAALRGAPIPEEVKEKGLNDVRQMHMKREALRRLSEADILLAFNKKMLAEKTDPDETSGGDSNSGNEATRQSTETRKTVTFDKELPTHTQKAVTFAKPNYSQQSSLMSWTQCGFNAATCVSDEADYIQRSQPSQGALVKHKQLQAMGAAAMKTVDLVARDSFMRAKEKVEDIKNADLACTARDDDEDDSSDESEIGSELSNSVLARRDPRPARSSAGDKSNQERLSVILSRSGSQASGRSFESRDTGFSRRTGYTTETRDTYDTRGTELSRGTRGSRDSYDSRESYDTQSEMNHVRPQSLKSKIGALPRRRNDRRYDAYSVAGTEYTEDTYDEFGCQGLWDIPPAFQ